MNCDRFGIISFWWFVVLLVLVMLEDLFRKILPGQPASVLVAKDMVLFALMLWIVPASILSNVARVRKAMLFPLLALLANLVYDVALIVSSENLWVPLIGLRADIFYACAMFVVTSASFRHKDWVFVYRFIMGLSVFHACGVVIETFLPGLAAAIPGLGPLSVGEPTLGHSFGDLLIPYFSGFFGSNAKAANGLLNLFVWLWLLDFAFRPGRPKALLTVSALVGIGILISGKRTPFLIYFGLSLYLLALLTLHRVQVARSLGRRERIIGQTSRRLAILVVTSLALAASAVFIDPRFSDLFAFLIDVATNDFSERFFGDSDEYFWRAEVNRVLNSGQLILGQGLGTSTMGVESVVDMDKAGYLVVEHGPLKVLLERGVFGLVLWGLLWLSLFALDFIAIKASSLRPHFQMAAMLVCAYRIGILFYFIKGHQALDDAQMATNFWLLTGFQYHLYMCSTATQPNLDARYANPTMRDSQTKAAI